jgi:hypothetical protein
MGPNPTKPIVRRAGLLAVVPALLISAAPGPVGAQISPNCERNGRRDSCAYTPTASASSEHQEVGRIVFADHTVYEVMRNESSCKEKGNLRTCDARITTPPGNPRTIPAWYRGTAYEGGYRHEYVGQGIHITYWFLD